MVFVHARNATVKTAMTLREMATNQGDAALFHPPQSPEYGQAQKQVQPAYNVRLRESLMVKKGRVVFFTLLHGRAMKI